MFSAVLALLSACSGDGGLDEDDYDSQVREKINVRLIAGVRGLTSSADEIESDESLGSNDTWREQVLDAANEFIQARVWFAGVDPPDSRRSFHENLGTLTDCYSDKAIYIIAMMTVGGAPSDFNTPSVDSLRGVMEACGPVYASN